MLKDGRKLAARTLDKSGKMTTVKCVASPRRDQMRTQCGFGKKSPSDYKI